LYVPCTRLVSRLVSLFILSNQSWKDLQGILHWFKVNKMAANPGKFQIMFLGSREPVPDFVTDGEIVTVSNFVSF